MYASMLQPVLESDSQSLGGWGNPIEWAISKKKKKKKKAQIAVLCSMPMRAFHFYQEWGH